MNDALMDAAYSVARDSYKAVAIETFKALEALFAGADFDAVHHATQRAMRLHIAATNLAEKIWAGTLPYEKAEEILSQQFSEFSAATRQRALSDAHTDGR